VKTLSIATPVVKSGGTVTFMAGSAVAANSTITGTSPVVANGVATSTVTITLKDIFLNPVSGVTPTFSATDTGSTNVYGTCEATPQTTDATGIATFGNLIINLAGSENLTASLGAVSIVSNPFNITAGAVATLTFVQQPTDALANASISPAVTVRAVDTFGNN